MEKEKAPWPKSEEELSSYIKDLTSRPHDYNTSAEAMSLAAQAAFNYVASTLGCTGFQAGWAQMRFIGDMRHLDLPFMIIDTSKILYPQYDIISDVSEFLTESKLAVGKKAKEMLDEKDEFVSTSVKARWKELADYYEANKKEEEE